MKKRFSIVLLGLVCLLIFVSCSSQSVKTPSWLQGTWVCSETGEKAVITKDNITMYDRYDDEEANVADMISEAKENKIKFSVKNETSGDTYVLTLVNEETNRKKNMSFTRESDREFSFMGYKFTK